MLKMDGLDEAIVGSADVWVPNGSGAMTVEKLIYSGEKIVKVLMERDGMTKEEAYEFVDFNIAGAYMGEETPVIVWPYINMS
jgi:hypothetical protein